jgi:hypothetical protein
MISRRGGAEKSIFYWLNLCVLCVSAAKTIYKTSSTLLRENPCYLKGLGVFDLKPSMSRATSSSGSRTPMARKPAQPAGGG